MKVCLHSTQLQIGQKCPDIQFWSFLTQNVFNFDTYQQCWIQQCTLGGASCCFATDIFLTWWNSMINRFENLGFLAFLLRRLVFLRPIQLKLLDLNLMREIDLYMTNTPSICNIGQILFLNRQKSLDQNLSFWTDSLLVGKICCDWFLGNVWGWWC